MQELGLVVVILVLGAILSIYGYYDARPGQPNTFLNFDNLIDGIATPMSYYAMMAVGVTIVIITSGIDISVGSLMGLCAVAMGQLASPSYANLPVAAAIGLTLLLATAVGFINGLLGNKR